MVMRIMHNKKVEKLDFRSLRMLKILLDTGSVTKAGEALSISQPAASRVLAQLRLALGDPLLVRGRHGNTLTPRAETLRPVVSDTLDRVSTLFASRPFDPRDSNLKLKIATTDNGAAIVLAPLAQQLAKSAPNIRIDISPWSTQTLSQLEDGRLDLALYWEKKLPENFHHRSLFREKYACLVRQKHPLLRKLKRDGSLNPREAAGYSQIMMLFPDGDQLMFDDVLQRLGYPPKRIAMSTPYFTSAPLLLAGTDNLILLPSRLGEILVKSAPVALIPLHDDVDFDYRLIWHERTQKDQSRSWIRSQIYNLFVTSNPTDNVPVSQDGIRTSRCAEPER
jgi:DNA-binding transcriptional LysR family regulator